MYIRVGVWAAFALLSALLYARQSSVPSPYVCPSGVRIPSSTIPIAAVSFPRNQLSVRLQDAASFTVCETNYSGTSEFTCYYGNPGECEAFYCIYSNVCPPTEA